MRRWIFMVALSAALLAIPVFGQRGGHGGVAMGSGHGGYAGAPRGGAYWGGGVHGGYGHGPYGYPGHYPHYPGHFPYYPGRYPWWGYRGGYGYGWYGYPWASWGWYGGAGWSGGNYSYPQTTYPAYVYSSPDNGNATVAYDQQQEIDRLNAEVARLNAERESGAAGYAVPQSPPNAQIRAATVLVFRDHHTEEIQDYAIVGKTLWVFTEQRARKIPTAQLDVPATTKANQARGIDFVMPK
jgi:hypothetical protein